MNKKFAIWIQGKTETWTPGQQGLLVLGICLFFFGLSAWICCQPLGKRRAPVFLKVLTQTNTRKLVPPDTTRDAGISAALFERIEAAKQNDSLLRARPKLIDSILVIETYYQSHHKK